MTEVPPVRREIVVGLDPIQAFELFTERIGEWWPTAELSVFGAGASLAFKEGELAETLGDRTARWGEVRDWIPGERLSFTWHPGRPAEPASLVSVRFEPHDRGTRVVLEHSGFEVFEDPGEVRREYDHGWPLVLDRYSELAGRETAYTWVALMHRPGPQAPANGSVFDDPRFGDHVSFLARMQEAGFLVAAGPMLDASGEGMTILRLPGGDRLDEAERLATTEDASVRTGFFEVLVRPWRVVMS